MPTCMAIGCSNTTGKLKCNRRITFHRIPCHEPLKKQWLTALCRTDLDVHDFIPTRFHVVCSDHFRDMDFYITAGSLFRNPSNPVSKLKEDAVPSVFNIHKAMDFRPSNMTSAEMADVSMSKRRKSSRYILVLFDVDGFLAILPSHAIVEGTGDVGEKISVLFEGELYLAEVLGAAEREQELQKLESEFLDSTRAKEIRKQRMASENKGGGYLQLSNNDEGYPGHHILEYTTTIPVNEKISLPVKSEEEFLPVKIEVPFLVKTEEESLPITRPATSEDFMPLKKEMATQTEPVFIFSSFEEILQEINKSNKQSSVDADQSEKDAEVSESNNNVDCTLNPTEPSQDPVGTISNAECTPLNALSLNPFFKRRRKPKFYCDWDGPVTIVSSPSVPAGATELRVNRDLAMSLRRQTDTRNPGPFGWQLAKLLYKEEELFDRNFFGSKNKKPLSPRRRHAIQHAFHEYFPSEIADDALAKGCTAINQGIRNMFYIRKVAPPQQTADQKNSSN